MVWFGINDQAFGTQTTSHYGFNYIKIYERQKKWEMLQFGQVFLFFVILSILLWQKLGRQTRITTIGKILQVSCYFMLLPTHLPPSSPHTINQTQTKQYKQVHCFLSSYQNDIIGSVEFISINKGFHLIIQNN